MTSINDDDSFNRGYDGDTASDIEYPGMKKKSFKDKWNAFLDHPQTPVWVLSFTAFLGSTGFTLVLPSLWFFLSNEFDGSEQFLGYIVAAFSLGQIIATPLFGLWGNYRPATEPILIGVYIELIGNILYGLAQNKWYLFVARMFCGIGSGTVAVMRSHLAITCAPERRTATMSMLSASSGLGFIFGPLIGSILSAIFGNHDIKHSFGGFSIMLNKYTAPAYIYAVIDVINILLILFLFRERPPYTAVLFKQVRDKRASSSLSFNDTDSESAPLITTEPSDEYGTSSAPSVEEAALKAYIEKPNYTMPQKLSLYWSVIVLHFAFFSVTTVFAVFETLISPFTELEYGWGTVLNGVVFASAGFIAVFVYILVTILNKYVENRKLFWVAITFNVLCFVFLTGYGFDVHLPLWRFLMGTFCVSVGYPAGQALAYAIFSVTLPAYLKQGLLMGTFTAIGSVARMLGPIWGSWLVGLAPSYGYAFGASGLLSAAALILLLVSHSCLKPRQ